MITKYIASTENSVGKGGGGQRNFTVEKSDRPFLSQLIKVNINSEVPLIAWILNVI